MRNFFPWRSKGQRRRPRELKTTREGKLLIAITLGLGFGAINSGNNLLYLILGMLLSLIVVSGVLSELTLRGIRVRRTSAGSPHAGKDAFFSFAVQNGKRKSGSFSVEVEELIPDGILDNQRPGYSLFLRPGEEQEVSARIRFGRRGVYESGGIRVATRFPFSFFRKWRVFDSPIPYVVYPALVEVEAPRLYAATTGAYETFNRIGYGGEYHGLREHRIEDDPRDIHWKTSARLGRLVAREYESTADRQVWLLVPNAVDTATQGLLQGDRSEVAELCISYAASLAAAYSSTGWAVGLWSLNGGIHPATGEAHLASLYDYLARLPVHYSPDACELSAPDGVYGERLLVVHPSQENLQLTGNWDSVFHVKQEHSDMGRPVAA
jgi:uncharacterized protein (DUF58 family)